jgi:hypothetical protein
MMTLPDTGVMISGRRRMPDGTAAADARSIRPKHSRQHLTIKYISPGESLQSLGKDKFPSWAR